MIQEKIVALSDAQLEKGITAANKLYRAGEPIMPDSIYDLMIAELKNRNPDHELVAEIEPEPEGVFGKTVELPERMLSTNKAYSLDAVKKWANDVMDVAAKHGYGNNDPIFRITPKLDGFAAYDDGVTLYTRGNGRQGTDITRAFERGLKSPSGQRGRGKGEIVVERDWFQAELSDKYENSRNIIASVIKEGDVDADISVAIKMKAVVFHPFSELNGWLRNIDGVIADLEDIWETNLESCKFDTDGLVIEVTDDKIKEEMGSTNHHHRWQIAFKKNTEFHDIEVTGIEWQTAKTGRITPVVQLTPTKVSGVTISRATGHHYGNVVKQGIGAGAIVRVCRSGQVIPYIESVVRLVNHVIIPGRCPSCHSETRVVGDNLICTNEIDCPAQIERTIEFFFKKARREQNFV